MSCLRLLVGCIDLSSIQQLKNITKMGIRQRMLKVKYLFLHVDLVDTCMCVPRHIKFRNHLDVAFLGIPQDVLVLADREKSGSDSSCYWSRSVKWHQALVFIYIMTTLPAYLKTEHYKICSPFFKFFRKDDVLSSFMIVNATFRTIS